MCKTRPKMRLQTFSSLVRQVIPSLAGDATEQSPPDLPSFLFKERIVYLGMSMVPQVTELMLAELLYLQVQKQTTRRLLEAEISCIVLGKFSGSVPVSTVLVESSKRLEILRLTTFHVLSRVPYLTCSTITPRSPFTCTSTRREYRRETTSSGKQRSSFTLPFYVPPNQHPSDISPYLYSYPSPPFPCQKVRSGGFRHLRHHALHQAPGRDTGGGLGVGRGRDAPRRGNSGPARRSALRLHHDPSAHPAFYADAGLGHRYLQARLHARIAYLQRVDF